MNVTPQGIMRVINGLSGPLKAKALKLLDKYVPKNVDPKGNVRNPLRKQSDNQATSQKATEGQRRYTVGEIKGIVKGVAGTSAVVAAYSSRDLINDLLGIKKTGDATLKGNEKPFVPKSKRKGPPAKVATKKKSKPPEPPKRRPKKGVTFEFKVGGKKDGR